LNDSGNRVHALPEGGRSDGFPEDSAPCRAGMPPRQQSERVALPRTGPAPDVARPAPFLPGVTNHP
jgi:hypothetical protein